MDSEQLYEQAVVALDVLEDMHKKEASALSFSAWVLTQFYPDIEDGILLGCDNSQTARALLLTRWGTGRLPFSPVAHLANS